MDGNWIDRRVWGDSHQREFPPPLGKRWLANLNVPDLQLFPKRFPNAKSVRVYAGLELPLFHLGTALLSETLGRGGLNMGASPLADVLHNTTAKVADLGFGSANGGMYVRVTADDGTEVSATVFSWMC